MSSPGADGFAGRACRSPGGSADAGLWACTRSCGGSTRAAPKRSERCRTPPGRRRRTTWCCSGTAWRRKRRGGGPRRASARWRDRGCRRLRAARGRHGGGGGDGAGVRRRVAGARARRTPGAGRQGGRGAARPQCRRGGRRRARRAPARCSDCSRRVLTRHEQAPTHRRPSFAARSARRLACASWRPRSRDSAGPTEPRLPVRGGSGTWGWPRDGWPSGLRQRS